MTTVTNNYYITKYTLEIRAESKSATIYPTIVHRRILDTNLKLDNNAVMVFSDEVKISYSKDIPEAMDHKTILTNYRIY